MEVAHLLLLLFMANNGGSRATFHALFLLLQLLFGALGAEGASTFSFANGCRYPVWVGALHGARSPQLSSSGFYLPPTATFGLAAPSGWSGTFWARTGCAADASTGRFACATADCGTGSVACDGHGPAPPATLVEVTLAYDSSSSGAGGKDFYDVSLVDGFNVPARIAPAGGGSGDCQAAACAGDVNARCPPELSVAGSGGSVVACRSACNAYGGARYCCTGEYGSPGTCAPTNYSQVFKSACPAAYSYAFDDASSTFTCIGAPSYDVTFCPN